MPVIAERSPALSYDPQFSRQATCANIFIAGSGSEISPDYEWYADGFMKSIRPTPVFNSVADIIKAEKSFDRQFWGLFPHATREEYYDVKAKMHASLSCIMYLKNFQISLQLTKESFYYTLVFPGTTIYFEHYFSEISNDMDEAIIGVFKDGQNILNYGGSLMNVFEKIILFFNPKPYQVTKDVYGLPFGDFTKYCL